MSEYRVVIPAKGNSQRAPGKNTLLLPFTLEYVKRLGLESKTFVLTDCPLLTEMARSYRVGVMSETVHDNDFAANFTASYRNHGWKDSDKIVLLEPTKPFRQSWLLNASVGKYSQSAGKLVTTGVTQPTTVVEYDSKAGKAVRRVGMRILDGCVIAATCGDFASVKNMGEFWADREVEIVWHTAPTGIDFDYPIDLQSHLPTVERLWETWYSQPEIE